MDSVILCSLDYFNCVTDLCFTCRKWFKNRVVLEGMYVKASWLADCYLKCELPEPDIYGEKS